jgi:hypothetical protein
MIFMSLFVGCIVYGIGGIHFIDALFFSTGAATQSGLNTYDFPSLMVLQTTKVA